MNISKSILVLLTTIIIGTASAQIKIDNLTISDYLAKEYFFDCYNKPDTIRMNVPNGGYSGEDYDKLAYGAFDIISYTEYDLYYTEEERQALEDSLDAINMAFGGFVVAFDFVKPRKPSAEDFMVWYLKRYNRSYKQNGN